MIGYAAHDNHWKAKEVFPAIKEILEETINDLEDINNDQ